MPAARRRSDFRRRLAPYLLDDIEEPGVRHELIELIAAEEDDFLVDRIVNEPRVGPLRRLLIELELRPRVLRGGVGPGAGIAAFALDVAAAEKDELLVVRFV